MAIDRDQKYREMAVRGKYRKLYTHLCGLPFHEWRTSFGEVESILGFELPASARLHRPWWANQGGGGGHSQAVAWGIAGWETTEVDLNGETLMFRRQESQENVRELSLDEIWPVHRAGVWPEGVSLSREDIYGDRV